MSKPRFTAQEINNKVTSFYNQMLFWFLINSGTSFSMEERKKRLQQTFDTAYEILSYAYNKKDIGLFNRIYSETTRLVASSNVPLELAQIRDDFYTKTIEFVQNLKLFVATGGRFH